MISRQRVPNNLGDVLPLPLYGERTAIIDLAIDGQARRFSSVEFDRLCSGVGRGLIRRGIKPGARIAILAENRVEFVATYFGIMRIGAVAVPINHKLPRATIAHIFRDSEIELAFGDKARLALAPQGAPTIDFDRTDADGFGAFLDAGPLKTYSADTETLAEILYTSGSTGVPKGVPLTHSGQLWAIWHYVDPIRPVPAEDSAIVVAPLYHMNGLFTICLAFANRLSVVLLPRFDARSYLQAVARHRCAFLSGIPTMYALMVRERDLVATLDLTCVREVSIGSAPLTDALFVQIQDLFPNARVENGYGTTEAGAAVFGSHKDGLALPPLSVGCALPDIGCELVGGNSPDEGVLALRTPALMAGYLNQPDTTAARMRDGWYLTGDVMRRDSDGFYYFVGRSDDMLVCGGENIYPGEVEKLLERHEGVAQAIVVAGPDAIKGQIPIAFIVPRAGLQPTVDEIKRYALEQGPAYAHPRFIEFVDTLPVSGTQKIDRTALTIRALHLVRDAGRST